MDSGFDLRQGSESNIGERDHGYAMRCGCRGRGKDQGGLESKGAVAAFHVDVRNMQACGRESELGGFECWSVWSLFCIYFAQCWPHIYSGLIPLFSCFSLTLKTGGRPWSCHKTSWWVINPKSLSRVYIRFITGLWWATLDINLL